MRKRNHRATDVQKALDHVAMDFDSTMLQALERKLLRAMRELQEASGIVGEGWKEAEHLSTDRTAVQRALRAMDRVIDEAHDAIDAVRADNRDLDVVLRSAD
jgi:predicted  nucleic acid-binding Zn-ribbon protein